MHASPLIRPSGRRSRWATFPLAVLIAVGSLSALGAASALALPLAAAGANPDVPQIVESPALKASPKLFARDLNTLVSTSGGIVEPQSLPESTEGFVQKVREAKGTGG